MEFHRIKRNIREYSILFHKSKFHSNGIHVDKNKYIISLDMFRHTYALVFYFGKGSKNDKKYGINVVGEYLTVFYGDTFTFKPEKSKEKLFSIPWRMMTHVSHKLLNLDRTIYADITKDGRKDDKNHPFELFVFKDYDGEIIKAKCRIGEMIWEKGYGAFKWLKYFNKPFIRTIMYITFCSEVGDGKGTWKGGTLGHSLDMEENENVSEAFKRYCKQQNLEFLGLGKEVPEYMI